MPNSYFLHKMQTVPLNVDQVIFEIWQLMHFINETWKSGNWRNMPSLLLAEGSFRALFCLLKSEFCLTVIVTLFVFCFVLTGHGDVYLPFPWSTQTVNLGQWVSVVSVHFLSSSLSLSSWVLLSADCHALGVSIACGSSSYGADLIYPSSPTSLSLSSGSHTHTLIRTSSVSNSAVLPFHSHFLIFLFLS